MKKPASPARAPQQRQPDLPPNSRVGPGMDAPRGEIINRDFEPNPGVKARDAALNANPSAPRWD